VTENNSELNLVKMPKPLSEMTDEEIEAFADEVWTAFMKGTEQ
jgi:hypothetical protein